MTRRANVKLIYASVFLSDMINIMLIFTVGRDLAERGADLMTLGLIGGAAAMAFAMSCLVFGSLSDRIGRWPLAICGVCLMGLASAGIQNVDKDGVPSRIAARGGLGAVLNAKGIKAIIIDSAGGEKPDLVDEEAFRAAQQVYNKALLGHPQTHTYADYGTAAMTSMCNAYGALPTRNFSAGQFENADNLSEFQLFHFNEFYLSTIKKWLFSIP